MDYKQFEETKELVIQVMNENKIGYNRDILSMGSAGYPNDACQDLAEECLELMAEYCRAGINGGFNGSIKDALDALSDICAQMSSRKKDRDADKRREACEKKKNDIVRNVKRPEVEEGIFKELVLMYIDPALQAIPALTEKNPAQKAALESSEKKLIQLRTSVEKVIDGASKEAKKKADEIVELVRAWRAHASSSTCDRSSLEDLDKAVNISHEWRRLVKPIKSVGKADDSNVTYHEDDIDQISKCADLKERMENLSSRIATARAQFDLKYDITAQESRKNALTKNIDELRAQKNKLGEDARNGVITMQKAVMMGKDIERRIANLNKDIERVDREISVISKNRESQDRTFYEVETLCRKINRYATEPAVYAMLASRLSFSSVDAIISGLATTQQISDFLSSLRDSIAVAEETERSDNALQGEIEEALAEQDRAWEAREKEEQERLAKNYGVTLDNDQNVVSEFERMFGSPQTGGDDPQPVDPIDLPTRRRNDDNLT